RLDAIALDQVHGDLHTRYSRNTHASRSVRRFAARHSVKPNLALFLCSLKRVLPNGRLNHTGIRAMQQEEIDVVCPQAAETSLDGGRQVPRREILLFLLAGTSLRHLQKP